MNDKTLPAHHQERQPGVEHADVYKRQVCSPSAKEIPPMSYDFDLFVIGAGSGGVRAARFSAGLGARGAVAESR